MDPDASRREAFEREAMPELDPVYRFALRLTGAPDQAEDLTQETFLRAFRSWESYTPGTRVRSWLFTICRNVFLRGRDRERRHDEVVASAADEDPRGISREAGVFMAARERDPEGAFWREVVDDRILDAIDALPVEFREAVVLSDLEDLPYAEIGEVLGVPVGTVKSRVFRGRRMLQEVLYAYAEEAGIVPERPTEAPAGGGRKTP
jgi:RNA polymerase sigma-70 factor, ECF subfamily